MKLKFSFIAAFVLFMSSQVLAQCPIQKTGQYYGFFRVTNFKQKMCWLSEPFAYKVANNQITNFDEIKECFKKKVSALGGNVESDLNDFGKESVVWLDNNYDPKAELESSYNWFLPSAKACLKYMKGEIQYKTGVGMQVKVVKMFSDGLMDNNEINP